MDIFLIFKKGKQVYIKSGFNNEENSDWGGRGETIVK